MGKTFRLLVCVLVVWPSVAAAQRFDDFGVRAQGMGGAFVAVADDASATWWNPAGLATALTFVDLSGSVLKGGEGSIALAFPSLGLSYYRLRISQIQPSVATTATTPSDRQDNGVAGSGLPSGEFGLSEFGATFGQSLTRHLVVATTVKLVNALGDTKADLDVGAMAAFGVVRVGVAVRDVREPTFGTGPDAFELTRRARAGAAVITPAFGRIDRIVLAVDADLATSPIAGRDEREVASGAELWWRGRRVGVRGGGGTNTVAGGSSYGAFGLTVVPFPRLNVDGAVTRSSDSTRDRWSLGVRLTF
jgi:hypothetical protein